MIVIVFVEMFCVIFCVKIYKIFKDNGNVDCNFIVDEVLLVLGNNWIKWGYKMLIEIYVLEWEYVYIWWGYKVR